jgi:hypothetical protein
VYMNTLSIHASYIPRSRLPLISFLLCYQPTTSEIVNQAYAKGTAEDALEELNLPKG